MKKKTLQDKSKLNKKLKNYATLAISVIAADATAQVTHTDIRDTTLINNGDFFDIDLNNDGINDLSISLTKTTYSSVSTYSSYYIKVNSVYASGSNSNDININVNSSSFYEVAAFNSNQSINNSVNSWSYYGLVGGYATGSFGGSTINVNVGQFPNQGDKFLGVRFNIGANTHFGWVRLDVSALSDTVTIKSFAYENTSNTPILAGDTGFAVGIDEATKRNIELYSSKSKLYFGNTKSQLNEIKVYDLTGKLLEERQLTTNQTELQLSKIYQGIYIIEVKHGEGIFRKKLWLESN